MKANLCDMAKSSNKRAARSSLSVPAMLLFGMCLLVGCSSGDSENGTTASIAGGDADPAAAVTPTVSNAAASSRDVSPQAAPTDLDPLRPMVLMQTSLGDIKIQLDREKAPVTVNNFLSYVDSGHFDGCVFHQVIDKFIVLGGGYDEQFVEKPTSFPIRNEADNGLSNSRGTIAMARQPDVIASSTSQFFFNVSDNASLDHVADDAAGFGYCVFGKVVAGIDVVDKISRVQVTDRDGFESTPVTAVLIKSVTRAR